MIAMSKPPTVSAMTIRLRPGLTILLEVEALPKDGEVDRYEITVSWNDANTQSGGECFTKTISHNYNVEAEVNRLVSELTDFRGKYLS